MCIFATLVILFCLYRHFFSENDDNRYYIMDSAFEDKTGADITGVVYSYNDKETYLKDVYINIGSDISYQLSDLLVYKVPRFKLGSHIKIHGTVYKPETSSNPGQFNKREYLREKNIYYTAVAKSVTEFVSKNQDNGNFYQNFYNLYLVYLEKIQNIKEKLTQVYKQALPKKECGIVTAMILGDKTLLDMDIKKLYQESGISHLLAISGLHISITGMAVYKLVMVLLIFICIAIKRIYRLVHRIYADDITQGYLKMTDLMGTAIRCISTFTAIIFIIMYGRMTGFGISVTRAIIMTVIMLVAPLIRRSYDMLSAMGISAVIILLKKPFAIYSCSFLLSFGAVLGIAALYPVLKKMCIFKHKNTRKDSTFWQVIAKKVTNTFLSSLAIQITTLPFILYFYYEFPLYGIFINIIVIPLASLLVVVCVAGGILGLVFMPLAKFILGSAYILLNIYETVCGVAAKLPYSVIITGKPAIWQMVVYFALIAVMLVAVYFYEDNLESEQAHSIKIVFFTTISLSFFVITAASTYTKRYNG